MAVTLDQLNIGNVLQNAEAIKAAQGQNRLFQLTLPYRERALAREDQAGVAEQNDATLKRNAIGAQVAIGIMGDLSNATPEEAQAKYNQARSVVQGMGIDISRIPTTYSPEVYSGIQQLASRYTGLDPTKYQFGGDIVVQGPDGKPLVGTLRKDPAKGTVEFVSSSPGGTLTDKTGLTPQEKATLEAATAGNAEAAKILARIGLTGQIANSEATIEGAKTGAKAQAETAAQVAANFQKKAQGAQNVMQSLDAADELLNKATGSYAGAFVDQVGQFVGRSTEGAQAIAGLKIIQADLMLGMPRMEGPQSDRDVQLYREAAASVGDPSVPVQTKRAAISTIRQLQARYAGGQPTAPASSSAQPSAPAAGSVKFLGFE